MQAPKYRLADHGANILSLDGPCLWRIFLQSQITTVRQTDHRLEGEKGGGGFLSNDLASSGVPGKVVWSR